MAQKTVSSWKGKKRFTVLAPENFDFHELGTTLATDANMLKGRTVDISLRELSGDRSKQHIKLVFEIDKVDGDKAYTKFKVFDVAQGYIRSKVRKGLGKIDHIMDLELEDGSRIRIKVIAITHGGVSVQQKKEIGRIVGEILTAHRATKLEQLIQLALFGKLGTEIYQRVKPIYPTQRVEIRHIRVI